MELNFSPVKTVNGYGINHISINDILEKIANLDNNYQKKHDFSNNFKNFKINQTSNCKINYQAEIKNENTLCDEIKSISQNNSNFNLTFDIVKSSDEIFKLSFNLDEEKILIDNINIIIEENINSKIILEFKCKNSDCLQNLNLHLHAKEGSNTSIILSSNFEGQSHNLVSIQTDVEKNAKLDVFLVDFSSKCSVYSYKSKLLGSGAESNLNSLYFADGNAIVDLNYLIEIYAEKCKTNMEVIGALSDSARKNFKGTINFLKGCKGSTGSENEFCMLLGKDTRSKALPMLLCTEEDVDGKHSSSVGKVDEKQLFYITSRGIDESEATRLIVKAKFNTLLKNLFDENIKSLILENIDRKIK